MKLRTCENESRTCDVKLRTRSVRLRACETPFGDRKWDVEHDRAVPYAPCHDFAFEIMRMDNCVPVGPWA